MEITRRPMRPQEAKRVRRELRGAPGCGMAILAVGMGFWSAVILGMGMGFGGLSGVTLGVAFVVIFAGVSVLTWRHLPWLFARGFRSDTPPLEEADLRGGEVEECKVRIRDAIVVEEVANGTAPYYLELEDGRVLFLIGQYLPGDKPGRLFPNRQLVIVRLPLSGAIIEVQCLGDAFAPSAQLRAFTALEHQQGEVPRDGQLLDGPLSRFLPAG
jgi:hypothetical protein